MCSKYTVRSAADIQNTELSNIILQDCICKKAFGYQVNWKKVKIEEIETKGVITPALITQFKSNSFPLGAVYLCRCEHSFPIMQLRDFKTLYSYSRFWKHNYKFKLTYICLHYFLSVFLGCYWYAYKFLFFCVMYTKQFSKLSLSLGEKKDVGGETQQRPKVHLHPVCCACQFMTSLCVYKLKWKIASDTQMDRYLCIVTKGT